MITPEHIAKIKTIAENCKADNGGCSICSEQLELIDALASATKRAEAAEGDAARLTLELAEERRKVHSLEIDTARLLVVCRASKKYLQPDLQEPGRTLFWRLVDTLAVTDPEFRIIQARAEHSKGEADGK